MYMLALGIHVAARPNGTTRYLETQLQDVHGGAIVVVHTARANSDTQRVLAILDLVISNRRGRSGVRRRGKSSMR